MILIFFKAFVTDSIISDEFNIPIFIASGLISFEVNIICFFTSSDFIPDTDLTPVLIIKGTATTGQLVESGFTITPDRSSDGLGPYFKVPRKDLTSVAGDIILGFK